MTRVKICGIRDKSHALAAVEAGADFIGLVFAPSQRQVTPAEAFEIANAVKKSGDTLRAAPSKGEGIGEISKNFNYLAAKPQVVGVFVNTPISEVNKIADFCALDWVQLSGDESWEYCHKIVKPIIKAIRVGQQSPEDIYNVILSAAKNLKTELSAGSKLLSSHLRATPSKGGREGLKENSIVLRQSRKRFITLLDSHVEGKYGGTGLTFDWKLAQQVARRFPVIIAGGLDPENVAQVIETVAPWGVDVSSGVEVGGVKDIVRIRAFIEAVRRTDASHVSYEAKQPRSEGEAR